MKNQLPKISIVTPSYNQAHFIEQTIQSVLNQDYPNLEFLVIDGGSKDGTVETLKKYETFLTWVSEPDSGQSNAINKGFKLVTGEIVAFLNSDDLYEPGVLHLVGNYFATHPEAMWLTGKCVNVDETGKEIRSIIRKYKNFWLHWRNYHVLQVLNYISQPATFWRREALQKIGDLDESLHYAMDYDYWLRLGKYYPLHVFDGNLACFRIHRASKSGSAFLQQFEEELRVAARYSPRSLLWLHRLHCDITVLIYTLLRHFE